MDHSKCPACTGGYNPPQSSQYWVSSIEDANNMLAVGASASGSGNLAFNRYKPKVSSHARLGPKYFVLRTNKNECAMTDDWDAVLLATRCVSNNGAMKVDTVGGIEAARTIMAARIDDCLCSGVTPPYCADPRVIDAVKGEYPPNEQTKKPAGLLLPVPVSMMQTNLRCGSSATATRIEPCVMSPQLAGAPGTSLTHAQPASCDLPVILPIPNRPTHYACDTIHKTMMIVSRWDDLKKLVEGVPQNGKSRKFARVGGLRKGLQNMADHIDELLEQNLTPPYCPYAEVLALVRNNYPQSMHTKGPMVTLTGASHAAALRARNPVTKEPSPTIKPDAPGPAEITGPLSETPKHNTATWNKRTPVKSKPVRGYSKGQDTNREKQTEEELHGPNDA